MTVDVCLNCGHEHVLTCATPDTVCDIEKRIREREAAAWDKGWEAAGDDDLWKSGLDHNPYRETP
jgi:hypothetical protein